MDESSSEDEEEFQLAGQQEEDKESLNTSLVSKTSKRGRHRIPESWTRVICLSMDDLTNLRVFELGPDLLMSNALKSTATRGKKQAEWKPLFWPDTYAKEGRSLKLEDNQLTE